MGDVAAFLCSAVPNEGPGARLEMNGGSATQRDSLPDS